MSKFESKWAVSPDGEMYHGTFEDRQSAIEEGRKSYAHNFFIGRTAAVAQPDELWSAERWLEEITEHEHYSYECGWDWDKSTPAERCELETQVCAVIRDWLDRHDLRPDHYLVVEPEEIQVQA
ncbi:MAG: hypothetical protein AAFP90_19925 [Planctomycetota bacterium]